MKKKLLTLLLAGAAAATMLVTMAGCGGSGNNIPLGLSDNTKSMEISEVKKDGLAGLCEYLEGNGALMYYTAAPNGKYYTMLHDIIGAEDGRKYYFQTGETPIVIELYEFDTDNLNDTAKSVIDSVKEKGSFAVYGDNKNSALLEVKNASMSESGKYMMINSAASTDQEVNIAENNRLMELFRQYDSAESKK